MRALKIEELNYVYGGVSLPPPENEAEAMKRAYEEAKRYYEEQLKEGLTESEARNACVLVGVAANAAGNYGGFISYADIQDICNEAVTNYIGYTQAGPKAVCEQVDGGDWNSETRECEY